MVLHVLFAGFSCSGGVSSLGVWAERVVLSVLLAVVRIVVVFSRLCALLLCFSVFSPLCSCAGKALFGRIKIMSITTFFLMKNVLRHCREKKTFAL